MTATFLTFVILATWLMILPNSSWSLGFPTTTSPEPSDPTEQVAAVHTSTITISPEQSDSTYHVVEVIIVETTRKIFPVFTISFVVDQEMQLKKTMLGVLRSNIKLRSQMLDKFYKSGLSSTEFNLYNALLRMIALMESHEKQVSVHQKSPLILRNQY